MVLEDRDWILLVFIPMITIFLGRLADYLYKKWIASLNTRPRIRSGFLRDEENKLIHFELNNQGNTTAFLIKVQIRSPFVAKIDGANIKKRFKFYYYKFIASQLDPKTNCAIIIKPNETKTLNEWVESTATKIDYEDINEKKYRNWFFKKTMKVIQY